MPITKCPACGGEVSGRLLRSGTFPCPNCNEPLRVREFNILLTIPVAACGYSLTFLIAQQMGLTGNGLFMVTLFLGCPASFLVSGVLGLLYGWLFPMPLERDPGPGFDDGGILHIESPPTLRKPPQ